MLSCALLVSCGGPDEAPPPESDIEVGPQNEVQGGAPVEQMLTVAVESDERVLVNGQPVEMEELADYVRELSEERTLDATIVPSTTVDASVLSDVERRLRDGGVSNVEVLDEGM
jgi:biopolymer transport protein ExbD